MPALRFATVELGKVTLDTLAIGAWVDRLELERLIILRSPLLSYPRAEPNMSNDFRREIAVYNANLIELLAYAGCYVVIRGEEIVGPFVAIEQAWATGRARYGSSPFLVQRVGAEASAARVG